MEQHGMGPVFRVEDCHLSFGGSGYGNGAWYIPPNWSGGDWAKQPYSRWTLRARKVLARSADRVVTGPSTQIQGAEAVVLCLN